MAIDFFVYINLNIILIIISNDRDKVGGTTAASSYNEREGTNWMATEYHTNKREIETAVTRIRFITRTRNDT